MIRSRGWRMISRRDVLGERVHLLGERETPAPYYIAANAFALTSRADPFPCVVHEAMAAETPVIAFSGVGSAPEALEGRMRNHRAFRRHRRDG